MGRHFNLSKKEASAVVNALLPENGRNNTTEGINKRNDRYRKCGYDGSQKSFGSSRYTGDTTSTNSSSIGPRSGTYRESTAKCFICDRAGHGWMHCPQKKGGRGCFRCSSEGYQFSRCPQRQESSGLADWGDLNLPPMEGGSYSSIFVMETHIMGVEGASEGSKLLYYPVAIWKFEVQALLDSGASVNCIDTDLADCAGCVIS